METVVQVLADEPVSPRRLLPKLPRDLETICMKCLQKRAVATLCVGGRTGRRPAAIPGGPADSGPTNPCLAADDQVVAAATDGGRAASLSAFSPWQHSSVAAFGTTAGSKSPSINRSGI